MTNKLEKIQDLGRKCVDHLTKESELLAELLIAMDSSESPIQSKPSLSINELNFHSRSKCIHRKRDQIKTEIDKLDDTAVTSVADIAKLVEPKLQQQLESASQRVLELTRSVEESQMQPCLH